MLSVESTPARSRWWVVYHGWAAACLFTALKVGGALGSLRSPELAAAVSATAGAIGFFGSKQLVDALDKADLPDNPKTVIKTLLPIAYFVAAGIAAARAEAMYQERTDSAAIPVPADVVMVNDTVQNAQGVTDANFDDTFLANTKAWLIRSTIEETRKQLGYDTSSSKIAISADATFLHSKMGKLALITGRFSTGSRIVWLIGIKGNELHQIRCLRKADVDISILDGPCADKIFTVFEVRPQQ